MADGNEERHAVIGSGQNFWLWSSKNGYDLTHPTSPTSSPIYPRVTVQTSTSRVTFDPSKTALVIIDMQNFFLSPDLGRPKNSKGIRACEQLEQHAIPAARKAGIQIVWLNWGLTDSDLATMPPAALKAFGFDTLPVEVPLTSLVTEDVDVDSEGDGSHRSNASKYLKRTVLSKDPSLYKGLGVELGTVTLENGQKVEAGRMLMRDQWNTQLYQPLHEAMKDEDKWVHKNRMSGIWGGTNPCTEYLDSKGIKTLIFGGVNSDQCVGGSLQDAFAKGYDCLYLSDGAATTSPEFAQQCIEHNIAKIMGFVLHCTDFAEGVSATQSKP